MEEIYVRYYDLVKECSDMFPHINPQWYNINNKWQHVIMFDNVIYLNGMKYE